MLSTLSVLDILYLKNEEDNELKLMINFSFKLFDDVSQFFPYIYFPIYFQGGKADQGTE